MTVIIPFFLINDHSIVVLRNPRKDILGLVKSLIARGILYMKNDQPIKVNITLWVIIDILPLLEKNNIRTAK
jgi:hypothetical protein